MRSHACGSLRTHTPHTWTGRAHLTDDPYDNRATEVTYRCSGHQPPQWTYSTPQPREGRTP